MSAAGFLLGAYAVVLFVQGVLKALNLKHLATHGDEVPEGFENEIDADLLALAASLTVQLETVRSTIEAVRDAASGAAIKVLVGGLAFAATDNGEAMM